VPDFNINLQQSSSSRYSSLRKRERAEAEIPAAEGAIHPETLRQKDRLCNELWRAAPIERRPPMGQRERMALIRHDNLSGIKDRGVNSFEFALFLFLKKVSTPSFKGLI